MNICILGISGLIGSTLFRTFRTSPGFQTTALSRTTPDFFRSPPFVVGARSSVIEVADFLNIESMRSAIEYSKANVIINCCGLTKHHPRGNFSSEVIEINALFPHRIQAIAQSMGARFIQISTDCVFSGTVGNYSEKAKPDAEDLYGRSKILGEVLEEGMLTIRTSTIGHELTTARGLLGWLLSQQKSCEGFANAYFSGLPTVTLATIIRDFILPRPKLSGLYHVGGSRIDKHSLLTLIRDRYNLDLDIITSTKLSIDRSLCIDKFCSDTGYSPKTWPELIEDMYTDYCTHPQQAKK